MNPNNPANAAPKTLNYDFHAAAAMIAALRMCSKEQRLDTLVVVAKAYMETDLMPIPEETTTA